jgi:hypothetical protein
MRKHNLLLMGLVLGPAVIVMAGQSLTVGGPSMALASESTVAEPPLPVPTARKPTDAHRAARERAEALLSDAADAPLVSPFYAPPRAPIVDTPDLPEEATPEPIAPTRTFRIGSIVLTESGDAIAMIDGKPCRLGGSPAPGYTVVEIDHATRRVVIETPAGELLDYDLSR